MPRSSIWLTVPQPGTPVIAVPSKLTQPLSEAWLAVDAIISVFSCVYRRPAWKRSASVILK